MNLIDASHGKGLEEGALPVVSNSQSWPIGLHISPTFALRNLYGLKTG